VVYIFIPFALPTLKNRKEANSLQEIGSRLKDNIKMDRKK
jgi:hypothetical protein